MSDIIYAMQGYATANSFGAIPNSNYITDAIKNYLESKNWNITSIYFDNSNSSLATFSVSVRIDSQITPAQVKGWMQNDVGNVTSGLFYLSGVAVNSISASSAVTASGSANGSTGATTGAVTNGNASGNSDGVYTVQSGDTLSKIAAKFGMTTDTIARLNGITNINLIRVGQQIRYNGNAPVNNSNTGGGGGNAATTPQAGNTTPPKPKAKGILDGIDSKTLTIIGIIVAIILKR